ncbi:MAG: hypothetical protein QXG03_01810 [Halalkalicoccus sp.]
MDRYTVDAVAALRYLVDALGPRADELFGRAEAGSVLLQIPSIALAETLSIVASTSEIRGRPLQYDPVDAREKLVTTGPLTVVEFANADFPAYLDVLSELTIRDAMIVASHEPETPTASSRPTER